MRIKPLKYMLAVLVIGVGISRLKLKKTRELSKHNADGEQLQIIIMEMIIKNSIVRNLKDGDDFVCSGHKFFNDIFLYGEH